MEAFTAPNTTAFPNNINNTNNNNIINPKPLENWYCSEVDVKSVGFKWTISKYSFLHKQLGDYIESSSFYCPLKPDVKWRLQLYPCGYNRRSVSCVGLFLQLVSCNSKEVRVKYKFCILNDKQQECNIFNDYGDIVKLVPNQCCGSVKFIERKMLLGTAKSRELLPEDSLTILCEVHLAGDSIVNATNEKSRKISCQRLSESAVLDDLGLLLKESKVSDVLLVVKGKEFRCHKAILSARSPVFYAMFETNMIEHSSSKIEIRDIDPEVVNEMLQFIYTGRCDKLEMLACDLLIVGDKYDIHCLKDCCEQLLSGNLTVDNVCDIVLLADRHSAYKLKHKGLAFVKEHLCDVINTGGWKRLLEQRIGSDGNLFTEICCVLGRK